jgi:hypothetical protein
LCRALLDAYPSRPEFAEVLFDIDKNLATIVGDDLDLELTVKRVIRKAKYRGWLAQLEAAALAGNPGSPALRAWRDKHRAPAAVPAAVQPPAPAPLPGPVNGPPPEWRQFDPVFFDLTAIRAKLLQAFTMPSGTLLGFGITYGDYVFLDKLQDIVVDHLAGETARQQPLSLKPEHGRVSSKVERVRRNIDDLDSANVLRVVHVDAAPADHVAEFWGQVRQLIGASQRHFVLLFVGDAGTAFPPEVTVLPAPRFDPADLTLWAASTVILINKVMRIGWPVSLAAPWTELLCAGASDGPELDVGMVYEAMDRSIKEIRFDAEGFRRKLESRMIP